MQCRARCHYGQFAPGWRMNMFFSKEHGLNLICFRERLHNGSSRGGMQQCEFKVTHSIFVPFSAAYIQILFVFRLQQYHFGPRQLS